jgi:hypothetical protein
MSGTVSTHKTVDAAAADTKHGMTLDELAAFVQEAMRAEIPGSTVVRITSTWRSSIKRIKATG